MKHILCFGDSLTWGYNPENVTRYPFVQRWTGFLQQALGEEYKIIEEGLSGRTTVFNDPFVPGRSGEAILPILLESHAPLDLVITMLGTNDLKPYVKGDALSAAMGCRRLIAIINESQASPTATPPKTLLLIPPLVQKPKDFMETIFEGAEEESKKFAKTYQSVANFFKVPYLDTAEFLTPSPLDGVHLDVKNNQLLAERVAVKVKEIL